jgi:phosphatidate cytidylyltransferase
VTRILSGAVLLVVLGSLTWFAPPQALVALAAVIAVAAFAELTPLARALGARVPAVPGAILTAAAVVAIAWPGVPVEPVLVAAVVVAAASTIAAGRPDRAQLAGGATLVAAPLYLAIPLGGLAGLRWTDGREAAVLVVLAVVASDTFQYYTGRALGRRPLAPAISPKKTVEGAIGGFAGATIVLVWLGAFWLPSIPVPARIGLGLTIAGLGIVGDLLESALKRAADVKDSSHLIPGHGGVLDRIDALLLAAPVYIAFVKYGPWRIA